MYFELYRDVREQWRWRLHAANGPSIANSGESYRNKNDAITAINIVQATNDKTPIREEGSR
ncbi:YegP family protein [Bradyrhizobium australafricanum]|uniref:YegP family protein n=1 Tax=Bradyrhizobium australafricanum TaxID=2821406 RepID=UPI0011445C8C|nr:DUF1508 domain-containing protein [Bradyrhizobium australafricanum]MCA6104918.1 DUF1508 domain-containing protein [Bradyrhizobium australafricanum]